MDQPAFFPTHPVLPNCSCNVFLRTRESTVFQNFQWLSTESTQSSCSVVSESLRPPWTAACQTSLSITNSRSLLKLVPIESVMPSNHLILCRPLLPCLQSFPASRSFQNESVLCLRWPKYWSFSFSISPFNEYSGLISFRMVWLDLLVVQGALKSLLQFKESTQSFGNSLSVYMSSALGHKLCKDLCLLITVLEREPNTWKVLNKWKSIVGWLGADSDLSQSHVGSSTSSAS